MSRPRPIRSDTSTENSQNDVPARSRDLEIREVAYALYEARGRVDGHELDDWLQATAQIERRTAPVGTR